jgi:hypothetical protein
MVTDDSVEYGKVAEVHGDDDSQEEMTSLVSRRQQAAGGNSSIKPTGVTKTLAPKTTSSRTFCLSSLVLVLGLCLLLFAIQDADNVDGSVDSWLKSVKNSSSWGSGSTSHGQIPSSSQDPILRKGTGEIDEPGYKMTLNRLSPQYLPRSNVSLEDKMILADKWGDWKFVDSKATTRPTDFYAKYQNRDVPRSAFPPNAWQLDTAYLSNFLKESIRLVERSMEAILGEYGRSKFDMPGVDFEERSKMFYLNLADIDDEDFMKNLTFDFRSSAGFMFQNGWEGLKRRILHAIMTEDSFTFVMGGHSAAAGHGNHFWQSYTLQMGKIIEPVFARLGVFFQAHNFGMGGLGTLHNALGSKDIYGEDIDILYWDSQMTENNAEEVRYFAKAGLISGKRAPVLWNMIRGSFPRTIAQTTGADVGLLSGEGLAGVEKMASLQDGEKLPWGSRFMDCDTEINSECAAKKYNTKCWVERDDFSPSRTQNQVVGGGASWHPGWRWHQLQGRIHAFTLLRATHAVLKRWNEAEGHALPDDAWHVTSHYEQIRSKTLEGEGFAATCSAIHNINPLFCTRPIHSRTEFTPRALGYYASIRSILKNDIVPMIKPNVYDPPDVAYSYALPPDGEVDVLAVIENGVDFATNVARKVHVEGLRRRPSVFNSKDYVLPGKGLGLVDDIAAADNCDGTWDSWCNRGQDQSCLLIHHNDGRAGITFDGLSGKTLGHCELIDTCTYTYNLFSCRIPSVFRLGGNESGQC